MEAALQLLEDEGLLVAQGAGRRRVVVALESIKTAPTLRVASLPSVLADRREATLPALQR